eukprot:TRINITY_DN28313_c0_g1_i1.p1 TRINITY_DN28313_c0_g1~~TRINITY_DN28313_c0_g1_i1.p1  ORF type:complete len:620 (+),score=69.89 TRINITY_DN28313_c0_g1_i1:137-1996(+)
MVSFNVGGWRLTPYSFGFFMCLLVVFIDMMGNQFLMPVLTPYALNLGLGTTEISSLFSATAIGQVVSSFLLPMLSDRRGRKVAIVVSVVGSIVGYLIQGLAFLSEYPGSYFTVLVGRAIAGLFAGTMPVTSAYLTELSMPDTQLLKVRMTTLMTVQQQAGNFLGPIAGSVATFGLYIPFLISAGTGLICLPFILRCFMNVDDIRKKYGDPTQCETNEEVAASPAPAALRPKGLDTPFCCDIVMNCYALCLCLIGVLMIGIGPILTFLLLSPVFGQTNPADPEQEQKNVAQVVSLCMLPFSLCQGIATTFVYVPLSTRLGDGKCCFVSAIVAVLSMGGVSVLAFFSDSHLYEGDFEPRIWMLVVVLSLFGFATGILFPSIMATAPKYRAIMYPHRLAAASAYCQRGVFVGMFAGSPVLMAVYERLNLMSAFLVITLVVLVWYLSFVTAGYFSAKKIAAKTEAEKRRADAEAKMPMREALSRCAMSETEFLERVHGMLDDFLEKRNYALWSRSDQALAEAELALAFGQLPEWQDADAGNAHNMEVLKRLQALGEHSAAQELLTNAPGIATAALLLQENNYIADPGAGVLQFSGDPDSWPVRSPAQSDSNTPSETKCTSVSV